MVPDMAKIATVGGVTGIGFLALSLGLPKLIEGLPSEISYGLAAVGGILVLVAFIWSLLNGRSDGGAPIAQVSHGSHSPNFGQIHGDVHITHAAPAAVQESKSLYGSGAPPRSKYQLDNLDALDRVMRGPRLPREAPIEPMPDLGLTELLVRVYQALGGAPSANLAKAPFYRKVDKSIADAVAIHRLHVWGRIGERPIELIEVYRWAEGLFTHKPPRFVWEGPLSSIEYSDLKFNRAEADRHWPNPPLT